MIKTLFWLKKRPGDIEIIFQVYANDLQEAIKLCAFYGFLQGYIKEIGTDNYTRF